MNAVADRRTVELTISRQGAYTRRILDQLQPGDPVWAKGPYGDFIIDARHGYPRAVLIAGGTGITPFCAFMDAALAQGTLPLDAALHDGAQTPELLIYKGLAERCTAGVLGFRAFYYAERQANRLADSAVQAGCIDLANIMANTGQTEATAFYLSGPKAMINTFRAKLVDDYHLSEQQVFIDAWE